MIKETIPLIFPENLDEAVDFYTNALGFVESQREDDFVELRSGTQTLWLHADRGLDDKEYEEELHAHKRAVGVNLSFEVDDVTSYYQRLVEKGNAPVEMELSSTPWGTKRFTVRDPNGVHLSFFSYE